MMQTEDEEAIFAALRFDEKGLLPAIAQQYDTKEILMLAWVNKEAIAEMLEKKIAVYYSRSRQNLWRKGETSGQTQKLVEMRVDCDGDALLLLVDQTGVACHTGHRSCFYRNVKEGVLIENAPVLISEQELYKK